MKILRIGDPHIRPQNLAESENLLHFIHEKITTIRPDRVEILGDLFHTHAIIRIEVFDFWDRWLHELSLRAKEVVVLVGNHDMTGDYNSKLNALKFFDPLYGNVTIVNRPLSIGIYGYLPYIHSKDEFVKEAQKLYDEGNRVLVCHQEFDGSQFENGFFSPHGVNPDDIPFKTIISGHIHREQIIAGGKVDYPGTPKWDSANDANEKKGIWLYEHDDSGTVISRYLISTSEVVTPIVSFTWTEGEEAPVIPEGARASVELIGSGDWVAKQKLNFKGKASIKSKITDKKRAASRKVGNSFENYLQNLYITTMDRTNLIKLAKELGIV